MLKNSLFSVFVFFLGSIAAACTLTVTYPNGGELLYYGQTYTIQWVVEGEECGDLVTIDLYQKGEFFDRIAEHAENSGTYSWTVPEYDFFLGKCLTIKITDESHSDVSDTSDDLFGTFPGLSMADPLLVIPVAAHAAGAYGSNWKTDLTMYNYAPTIDCAVNLTFLKADQDNSIPDYYYGVFLPPLRFMELKDVVAHITGQEDAVGAIVISPSAYGVLIGCGVSFISRTYNDLGEGGTYGQMVPAIRIEESIWQYGTSFIGLKQNEHYRSNMGFVNFSPYQIVIHISLMRENASLLGEKDVELLPYSFHQELNILAQVTSENVENAKVLVECEDPEAVYFAYVSVIDNRTGDAIFIPQADRPCKEYYK